MDPPPLSKLCVHEESMDQPKHFNTGRIQQQRPESPDSSCASVENNRTMDPPPLSKTHGEIHQERPDSPAPSCVSMKSDWSMGPPIRFNSGRIHQQRPDSPAPSYVSMKSDWSMGPPIRFNSGRTYEDVISKSSLISSGPPAVYLLRPKKKTFGNLTRKTVGEKNLNKKNKTILLVGETGTGKSTLINILFNYTMGVKFEENIWFEIVEEEKRSQTESQTSDVILYEIFGFEDITLPFSLTIIDTPGYGDTRGIERDVIISQRLFDLFRSEDGVHEIDAVGLVLKATENQLSERQKYIFDSVTSLFGKDLEKNIVALITHSDGITPENVLQILDAANIKCAKNEENQLVHFLFNNCQTTQRTEETKFALENTWRVTERGMKQFTDFLEKSKPQQLITTVEVMNARIRITACIQNLQERIQLTELKQKRNKVDHEQKKSLLENLQSEMEELKAEKIQLLAEVYQHVEQLERIALNDNSLSTHVHLDFLIEKMKEIRATEKVKKLEEIKEQMDKKDKAALRYMFRK